MMPPPVLVLELSGLSWMLHQGPPPLHRGRSTRPPDPRSLTAPEAAKIQITAKTQTAMQIKVSKVFAQFVNRTAEKHGKKFSASVKSFSANAYRWNVADPFDNDCDYSPATDEFKALCVTYPDEYYALPAYWTTAGLCAEFRRRGVKTAADLESMIIDLFEV